MDKNISSRKPFGLPTNFSDISNESKKGFVKTYGYLKEGYIDSAYITQNKEWIDKIKVYISKAYGEVNTKNSLYVLGKPFIGEEKSCCLETYLVAGVFDNVSFAENLCSYIKTKFFRFLVSLKKNTQDATAKVYSFVPMQDFSKPWTDEELYKKYGLNDKEIAFIDSMIRPME